MVKITNKIKWDRILNIGGWYDYSYENFIIKRSFLDKWIIFKDDKEIGRSRYLQLAKQQVETLNSHKPNRED